MLARTPKVLELVNPDLSFNRTGIMNYARSTYVLDRGPFAAKGYPIRSWPECLKLAWRFAKNRQEYDRERRSVDELFAKDPDALNWASAPHDVGAGA
jgi:hypothetical protein